MEKVSIYPKVNLYRNAIPNLDEIMKTVKRSESNEKPSYHFEEWKDWYGFGIFMGIPMPAKGKSVPTDPKNEYAMGQKLFIDSISEAYYNCTQDYIDEWDYQLPNWHNMGISLCKYNDSSAERDYAMHYHTDWVGSKRDQPGHKFGVTCTLYLNDDYEGGEISFLEAETGNVIDHKPRAGDVMVFPSTEPYYHAVLPIKSGSKYLVRAFWCYEFDGTPEWHANLRKYGLDAWAKMEKEREEQERAAGRWHKHVVKPGEEAKQIDGSTPFVMHGYRESR